MKIPKDKLTEKGEYSLKDDVGLQNCPKEPLKPSKAPMTDAEYEKEMSRFLDSLTNKVKKSPYKKK